MFLHNFFKHDPCHHHLYLHHLWILSLQSLKHLIYLLTPNYVLLFHNPYRGHVEPTYQSFSMGYYAYNTFFACDARINGSFCTLSLLKHLFIFTIVKPSSSTLILFFLSTPIKPHLNQGYYTK